MAAATKWISTKTRSSSTYRMTAADSGDPGKGRYVTVALPREALVSAMAAAAARPGVNAELGLRLVDEQ
jgi:hypothetical protein